jgi:hypothetical protein
MPGSPGLPPIRMVNAAVVHGHVLQGIHGGSGRGSKLLIFMYFHEGGLDYAWLPGLPPQRCPTLVPWRMP